jgi:hypothetical protein
LLRRPVAARKNSKRETRSPVARHRRFGSDCRRRCTAGSRARRRPGAVRSRRLPHLSSRRRRRPRALPDDRAPRGCRARGRSRRSRASSSQEAPGPVGSSERSSAARSRPVTRARTSPYIAEGSAADLATGPHLGRIRRQRHSSRRSRRHVSPRTLEPGHGR